MIFTPEAILADRDWQMTGNKLKRLHEIEVVLIETYGSWKNIPNRIRTALADSRRSAGQAFDPQSGWFNIHNSSTLGS